MDKYMISEEEEVLDAEPPFVESMKAGVKVMELHKNTKFGNIIDYVKKLFEVSFASPNKKLNRVPVSSSFIPTPPRLSAFTSKLGKFVSGIADCTQCVVQIDIAGQAGVSEVDL